MVAENRARIAPGETQVPDTDLVSKTPEKADSAAKRTSRKDGCDLKRALRDRRRRSEVAGALAIAASTPSATLADAARVAAGGQRVGAIRRASVAVLNAIADWHPDQTAMSAELRAEAEAWVRTQGAEL